jgi:hypothetical protein
MPKSKPIRYEPMTGSPEEAALSVTYKDAYLIWEKTELYEVSIVTLPSNPKALRIKSGAMISQTNKELLRECIKLCGDHEKAHATSLKEMTSNHEVMMKAIQTKLNYLVEPGIEYEEDTIGMDLTDTTKEITDLAEKGLWTADGVTNTLPTNIVIEPAIIIKEQVEIPKEEIIVPKELNEQELKDFFIKRKVRI